MNFYAAARRREKHARGLMDLSARLQKIWALGHDGALQRVGKKMEKCTHRHLSAGRSAPSFLLFPRVLKQPNRPERSTNEHKGRRQKAYAAESS